MVVAEAKFLATAQHAHGFHAAQLAFFDSEATGEDCAGKREGDLVTSFEVLCAADDLTWRAGTIVHLTNAEFVGIRVLLKGVDLSHDDFVCGDTAFFDAFHFNAGEGEEIGELGDGVGTEVEMGAEPGERDLQGRTIFLTGLTGFQDYAGLPG